MAVFAQFTNSNLPIIIIRTDGNSLIPNYPSVLATMKIVNNGVGYRNYLADTANILSSNHSGRIENFYKNMLLKPKINY